MYSVKFVLRNDTKDYKNTNLKSWMPQINKSIEAFNYKISRLTDCATMKLVEIAEKYFTVLVDIDDHFGPFGPSERSFYARIGGVSRTLKKLGMHEIMSSHGKLFILNVEGNKKVEQTYSKQEQEEKKIYIEYKNKSIMIPKEMVEEFLIKFY